MTKCSDDSSLFHACLRRQIDLAAKEACWFPTVPFVRSENEPCRNGSEVARSRGRLRQAVEDLPSKCDVLCRDIRVKVGLSRLCVPEEIRDNAVDPLESVLLLALLVAVAVVVAELLRVHALETRTLHAKSER